MALINEISETSLKSSRLKPIFKVKLKTKKTAGTPALRNNKMLDPNCQTSNISMLESRFGFFPELIYFIMCVSTV